MGSHRRAGPGAPDATPNPISVGVVGGIGGLGAALSLLEAGFDVQVYEQAPAPEEVGAGLQVSLNAARVLYRLGLAGELARTGSTSATSSPTWPTAATMSRRGSPTAPGPRSRCWWAPTASTRRSAACSSARKIPISPAVSPTAGWSRPTGWPTSTWR
jgi:hypothetical protein